MNCYFFLHWLSLIPFYCLHHSDYEQSCVYGLTGNINIKLVKHVYNIWMHVWSAIDPILFHNFFIPKQIVVDFTWDHHWYHFLFTVLFFFFGKKVVLYKPTENINIKLV